jgi:glutathione S-transferase
MALVFYHGHGSPYGWRAWLALEHKRIPYELKILSFADGDTKKPEFVAINPRHQVPTIVDDGFTLWESGAILEYLDERFPSKDAAASLYPGDARARARIRRLGREIESYLDQEGLDPIVMEHFFKDGAAPDEGRVAKARERVKEELEYFSRELRGKFLAGDAPTAADFILYPEYGYVKRLTFRKPELKLTDLVPAPLAEWGKRIEALPYFEKTFPPHWRG